MPVAVPIEGESKLPACPGDQKLATWHNCFGSFTFPTGEIYTGSFVNGESNGYGTSVWPDGRKYVGEYKDGKRYGQGTVTYRDPDKSSTEVMGRPTEVRPESGSTAQITPSSIPNAPVSPLFTGSPNSAPLTLPTCPTNRTIKWNSCYGEWTSNDGLKYVGEFYDGLRHGNGATTSPNGDKYIGEFSFGKRDGKGTWTFTNGDIYRGEFRDDKPHGIGIFTFSKGGKYEGDFKDGKRSGKGTLTSANAESYVGDFKDNQFHGRGIYTWSSFKRYEGEFKSGKRDGQGTMYGPFVIVLQSGQWKNDDFLPPTELSPPVSPAPNPPAPKAPPSPQAKPQTAEPSFGSGSAFRIANGYFVTNQHVINGCVALAINGYSNGRVVAQDQKRDLAVLSLPNDSGPIASVRTTKILLGESVLAAGFPLEGILTGIATTSGTITRLSGLGGDTSEVQISAAVQPGNSGGPLLDISGNVIGVVSSKLNALKVAGASGDIPQNVNFAINGSSLRAFLDAKNVNYKEVANERELTGVQIAARASAFTVLIECQR